MNDTSETGVPDLARRERIRAKVAASQKRIAENAPSPRPAAPPLSLREEEGFIDVARKHPFLLVAGGIAAGALIGSIIPKSAGGKLGKRALAMTAFLAEFAGPLLRQAVDGAEEAGRISRHALADAGETVLERTADARQNVRRMTGHAAGNARAASDSLVQGTASLIGKIRR